MPLRGDRREHLREQRHHVEADHQSAPHSTSIRRFGRSTSFTTAGTHGSNRVLLARHLHHVLRAVEEQPLHHAERLALLVHHLEADQVGEVVVPCLRLGQRLALHRHLRCPSAPAPPRGCRCPPASPAACPNAAFVSSTGYSLPPIHHLPAVRQRLPRAAPPGSSRARRRNRRRGPSRSGCSGGFLCKLLHEPRRRGRELRALAGPVLHALHVDAQRLAPLRAPSGRRSPSRSRNLPLAARRESATTT